MYEPHEGIEDFHDVYPEIDYLEADEGDTSGHGSAVLAGFYAFSDRQDIHLYRVVNEDGDAAEGDIADAISSASLEGIDVLNLSVGVDHIAMPWKECNSHRRTCALCYEVKKAVERGTTVVAGAGNVPPCGSLCCPGLAREAICVAGFETRCGCDTPETNPVVSSVPDPKPPGALWLESDVENNDEGPFCSMKGCGPGFYCADNKYFKNYQHNPEPVGGKPDTLAPAHVPMELDNNATITHGTSFAAPIVTAQVANMLSAFLSEVGDNPPHRIIKKAVQNSGSSFDGSHAKMFSGSRTFNDIGEPVGMEYRSADPKIDDLDPISGDDLNGL